MSEQPIMDASAAKVVSLAGETKFTPNGIVSRTLLRTANSRVVLFGFAEGQELTEHTSTQHALVEILSGECEFSLAGQPHALKAGDLLYMPPNLPHAAKATTKFSMLLTLTKPDVLTKPEKIMPPENYMGADGVMDVRELDCSVKHPLLVKTFVALPAGEHFIIRNGHEPIRLRDQFAAQWPGTFTWEKLPAEPGECRIQIMKLKPLGEAVVPVAASCEGH